MVDKFLYDHVTISRTRDTNTSDISVHDAGEKSPLGYFCRRLKLFSCFNSESSSGLHNISE